MDLQFSTGIGFYTPGQDIILFPAVVDSSTSEVQSLFIELFSQFAGVSVRPMWYDLSIVISRTETAEPRQVFI